MPSSGAGNKASTSCLAEPSEHLVHSGKLPLLSIHQPWQSWGEACPWMARRQTQWMVFLIHLKLVSQEKINVKFEIFSFTIQLLPKHLRLS